MAADEPREQKDAKRPGGRSRKKQKTWRGPRPMPDVAKLYIEKQVAEQTPMVFVTLDAALHTTVVEHGAFQLGLQIVNVGGRMVHTRFP